MDSLEGFVSDDALTYEPLAALGWQVHLVSWRNTDTDWSARTANRYDAVIIRTPWDYQQAPQAFLEALARIEASGVPLENCLDLVQWNINKTYLRDLEQQEISIVPTQWGSAFQREIIESWWQNWDTPELIIKPTVSANADDTFRITRQTTKEVWETVAQIFRQRSFMVQPFIPTILKEGEYSLFFFGGSYSHSIVKIPKPNDFRVQEEHGGLIQPTQPTPELRQTAQQIYETIPHNPLYARIDLVRLPSGEFALMEVELIEPSLYFRTDAESPYRFARAIDERFR
jgi:glutathione synthase/RimK-type ligase-like ATP-grasp enzyme